ncbi:MAG TPA: PDZ domain-containing protein, partial [Prosthecobacter sp.]|nr:PDZ domain-containing protein [Prosthecobacter sp.]
PKEDAPPQPRPTHPRGNPPRDDHSRGDRFRSSPAPEEKPTPFIGVLTTHVSPELRAQLGLQEGFGLQVVEVMPDSPAKAAGLKEHDILVKLEDQKLVSMEQLQALIRSKKKDDEAAFTVITGGKETQVTVKVAERMMPVRPEEPRRTISRFYHPGSGDGDRPQFSPFSNHRQDDMERFQQRLREYQERLQEWSRSGHRGPMPTLPSLEGHGGRDAARGEFDHAEPSPRRVPTNRNSAGVTRRDESGTYSLSRDDDHSTFTVRPNGGGEHIFTFRTDSERNAVPEEYRAKLRMLEQIAEDMRRGSRPEGPKEDSSDRRPDSESRPKEDRPSPPPPGRTPARDTL